MEYLNDGMNKKTFKELFETKSFNDSSKEFRNNIYVGFKLFTLKYPFKKNMNPLVVLYNLFDMKKINIKEKIIAFDYLKDVYYYFLDKVSYDKKEQKYIFNDEKRGFLFDFRLLSDNITGKNIKKSLTSSSKFNDCHAGSMTIIPKIDNSYLCTGIIDNFGFDTLHTVIEFNEDKIIDYTLNIIIDKNEYNKITNFREIQRIKKENYLDDIKILDGNLDSKTYLTYRDEIIRDLNKNKKVLKLSKEELK